MGPDEVGKALKANEISSVVLNVCQSARFSITTTENFAAILLLYGVTQTVAISYLISSSAVEIFVNTFNTSLFAAGLSFV